MSHCGASGGNGDFSAISPITSELLTITDGIADGAWTTYSNVVSHVAHEAVMLTSSDGSVVRFQKPMHKYHQLAQTILYVSNTSVKTRWPS